MIRYFKYTVLVLAAAAAVACSEEPLDPQSQVIDSVTQETEFDKWLQANYIDTYNIELKWRMETNESDMNYWLVPARVDKSIQMAKLMKFLCFEAYDEITGSMEFIRSYYPKMIHLIGSAAYNNNNTFVLGTAEGGLKITMYMINELELDPEYLNEYYFKTMHHEFAHILNQTKPYSTDFDMISGSEYVSDAWSSSWNGDSDAQQHGFISEYASKESGEDFVELLSIYVTSTEQDWNNIISRAGSGASILTAKFDIVYNYMLNSWNIDLDELREVIQRRQGEIDTLDLDNL